MLRLALAFALLVVPGLGVRGAGAESPRPIYHGFVEINPARGRLTNLDQMTATLTVRNWLFLPSDESNGIVPGTQDVVVAIGENNFTIPAGSLQGNASGSRFAYRAQATQGFRGVRSVRIVRKPDKSPLHGWYSIRFQVQGLDLIELYDRDPVCLPMAFIVGDDDGFDGVELTRKSFSAKRFKVSGRCNSDNSWPWL